MACLVLFGFTTILGWDYYGERCLEYFSNGSMKAVKTYRWLYIAAVFIGPYMTVAAVWTIADIFNGLMALPNMIALIALSGVVVKETKDYFARLAAAGNEDEMAPHLPGDNWDILPIDPWTTAWARPTNPLRASSAQIAEGTPRIATPRGALALGGVCHPERRRAGDASSGGDAAGVEGSTAPAAIRRWRFGEEPGGFWQKFRLR